MTIVKLVTSKDELVKVHAIRKKVFVVEQGCPEDIEWEYEDESKHFIAIEGTAPAGTARWRRTLNGIKLERFAVLKEFRNKKVGKALLMAILKDISTENVKIYLHAQITSEGFYLKNGFRPEGEHFWEAGIEHVKMVYEV